MTDVLTHIAVWLNAVSNAMGSVLLAPVAVLPGWLSATAIAAVTGLMLLLVFKYTSNQRAIKRARDDIRAHRLGRKLFKQNASAAFRTQGRIIAAAFRLLALAVPPTLVMVVPVLLLWGQMALWYQSRPLRVGEEAVVSLELNGDIGDAWPEMRLRPTDAAEVTAGPVRMFSQGEVCWSIRARKSGYHRLVIDVEGRPYEKELAVGNGYMQVSAVRPAWCWTDILLYPAERPFSPESPVQSIRIDYPRRDSWTSGADRWAIYWFAASLVAALCFRPWLRVNI
ncbi:MAG: protease inhibitor I42 family protein [Rhodopirellula sp.]|nr:protease inhibitor I42 family protein [Rhodopirellula sp.]